MKALLFILATALLPGQAPTTSPAAPPAAAAMPATPPPTTTGSAETAPDTLRAQYAWGYSGKEGEGKGTLSVLLEPASGKVVLELHGLGERLMLLTGDQASGYRVQIPRRELDQQAAAFGALPLPFLPQLGTPEALHHLLTEGTGPGVKITKRDAKGPIKLRYSGKDEQGKSVIVWLERTLWEPTGPKQP